MAEDQAYEQLMYVKFNEKNGDILGVSPRKYEEGSVIPVLLSEIKPLVEGFEKRKNYKVEYDSGLQNYRLVYKPLQILDGFEISNSIYEVPKHLHKDPEILIVQDIPHTCWKIKIGGQLRENINYSGARIDDSLEFSITKEHDPNILYRMFEVDLNVLINQGYVIKDFVYDFETDESTNLSVFTPKKFNTYRYERLLNG